MLQKSALPILATAFLFAAAALAQSTNATIYGTVTDASGASAPRRCAVDGRPAGHARNLAQTFFTGPGLFNLDASLATDDARQ